MTPTPWSASTTTFKRIDMPCDNTGFTPPPCGIHIRILPASDGLRTILGRTSAGRADLLAAWLRDQPGVEQVAVGPGLAPKTLRATLTDAHPLLARVLALANNHHLMLGAEGHAVLFIEGSPANIVTLERQLTGAHPPSQEAARIRPALVEPMDAPLTRRQSEALERAVAWGYYEIPHRIDLRHLAALDGVGLGSFSALLRRAECTVLTQYVDRVLLRWPDAY